ncbi:MAG: XRE family transcriptional regulator [Bacteroidales bacterium]|nr:XRE family transcriptional regulator [Bacteroidales bacterium]
MKSFGDKIRQCRLEQGLLLRVVAARLEIDQAILSKIERGKRKARRDLVIKLARLYKLDTEYLLRIWLSDRILDKLEGEQNAEAVLQVAEETLAYRNYVFASRGSVLEKCRQVMGEFPAIQKAWVFGSFARKEEGPESDIDVLIEVPESVSFSMFDMAEVRERLKLRVNKEVDVVLSRALKPGIAERVHQERRLFYEAG